MIKDVLDGIKKPISSDMIVSKDPLEQKINVAVSIQYEDNISLLFNKTYAGSLRPVAEIPSITAFNVNDIRESYSHNLRPDIIITKDKETVFTAKMSLAEYLHGKMKNIDKMHTYRDAICNVAGAFILYPGEESGIYPAHCAKKYYEGGGHSR